MDMELKGCAFTWLSNPRNGVIIREKLDRILANQPWRHDHPHAIGTALFIVSSDHSSLILQPFPKEKSGTAFNFKALWAEHDECFGVMENEWRDREDPDDPWGSVRKNLKACQKTLQSWQKKTFKKVDDEIYKLKSELQRLIDQDGQVNGAEPIRRIQKQIDDLWRQEEMYWGQRARVKWLSEGDKNKKNFTLQPSKEGEEIGSRDYKITEGFGWKAKKKLLKPSWNTMRKSISLILHLMWGNV